MQHHTITLIGMPGAGKSTVGVLLAKRLGLNFVDTDLLIQVNQGETLQTTVDKRGYRYVRELEEELLLDMPLDTFLVATGGSAVYGVNAMHRLGDAGPVVYLSTPLEVLELRVAAHLARGIACAPGQSFADIFAERAPLYDRYADLTIPTENLSVEDIAAQIARQLGYR
jgi:shikimate kinase